MHVRDERVHIDPEKELNNAGKILLVIHGRDVKNVPISNLHRCRKKFYLRSVPYFRGCLGHICDKMFFHIIVQIRAAVWTTSILSMLPYRKYICCLLRAGYSVEKIFYLYFQFKNSNA